MMLYKEHEILTVSIYEINGRCSYHKVMIISPNGRITEAKSEAGARLMIDAVVDGNTEVSETEPKE